MSEETKEEAIVGLCATCQHTQRVHSGRGSTFYLCRRANTDQRFVKYPALPVRSCAGYDRDESDESGGK